MKETRVIDRLGHALDSEEVAVVGCFPYAAGVSVAGHVAGDPDVVGGSVRGMRGRGPYVCPRPPRMFVARRVCGRR